MHIPGKSRTARRDRPASAGGGGTPPRRVTLLTDFGTRDGYAGAMHGVLATRSPNAFVEDISHDVPRGDIAAAAFALLRYWCLYPEGTVHVVVVDPGVGGSRRALAAVADRRYVVAPDNGVITHVLRQAGAVRLIQLTNPDHMLPLVSGTFHGRDVFAPAAAFLAAGGEAAELGPELIEPVMLALNAPQRRDDIINGTIIHVDHFGNLITNVPAAWVGAGIVALGVGGRDAGPVRRTYEDVGSGELVALIGSADLLEVSVRDGSAAERLGVSRGAPVAVRLAR